MTAPGFTIVIPLCALLGACVATPPATVDANTPGYTGRTVLIGNNSTLAGNAEATFQQQNWGMTMRR